MLGVRLRLGVRLLLAGAWLLPALAAAQEGRIQRSLNDGWRFQYGGQSFAERFTALVEPGKFRPFERAQEADAGWERVTLPHTWNAKDPFDDVEGYRRGLAWYRRYLTVDSALVGRQLFLHFEGVNQVADVYVNGGFAGRHEGGYSAFTLDITRWVEPGVRNLIAVQVSNANDPFIAPLSVGYALYGGIYRDVWLVATAPVHVTLGDHGSNGTTVSTPMVSRDSARVAVRTALTNAGPSSARIRLRHRLVDAAGRAVTSWEADTLLGSGGTTTVSATLPTVPAPRLWHPDHPTLYRLHTELLQDGVVRDRVSNPVGFRWFRFSGTGFELNGEQLTLRGTNRHQDHERYGSALSNALHRRDLEMIKAMGANFLRLGHYPQDPAVLEAADELGILLWEEIPVVNYVNPEARFVDNTERQLREMIRQHRNHPAMILWGLMNEPLLWSPGGERTSRQSDTTYLRQLRTMALRLDSVARTEDPTRATTMALHGSEDYERYDIGGSTPVVGVNRYDGWYGGRFEELGKALDKRHALHPDQALMVSEYGAEDDFRVNSLAPERFDFSGSWQRRYHESYLRQFAARPWLAGTAVWNQFDFSQPEIGGSIPYRNQKGLQTWDREYKDVYFLYQANWTSAPMVRIASRTWTRRTGTDTTAPPGAGPRPVRQPVDVYSNADRVELVLNGRSLGTRTPDDVKHIEWMVPFEHGENVLEARATRGRTVVTDRLPIHFTYLPSRLADTGVPFREVAVNVGVAAEMADADGVIWMGDRPYTPGRFGSIGGKPQQFSKELPVRGTTQPPLYFTYREGIEGFRFDVPDGDYELELRFAEPSATGPGQRVFDVLVNGAVVVARLDLAAQAGTGWAVPIAMPVRAAEGTGVQVTFRAITGQPILSAIRVRRR